MIDFRNRWKGSPCQQLSHVLNLRVGFQHHEVMLSDDQVNINHALPDLFRHLPALVLYFYINLVFLLTGEYTAVRV